MIDGSTAAALGGVIAMALSGYGSMAARRAQRAGEKTVEQTKNTSNGFADAVRGDLTAIRAHLAAQDMHMVAQDEQVAEIRRVIVQHDKLLKSVAPIQDKD